MSTHLQLDETQLSRAGALWTAREIAQQPASWVRTQELLRQQAAPIAALSRAIAGKQPDLRIILTGAGTSAFIGECLAPPLLQRLGRRVDAIATTDLLSGPRAVFPAGGAHAARILRPLGRAVRRAWPWSIWRSGCWAGVTTLVFTCNEQGTLYQHCRGAAQQPGDSAAAGNARPELCDDFQFHGHDAGGRTLVALYRRRRSDGRGRRPPSRGPRGS